MLVNFSFKNVTSFKEAQNLSLEISPLKKDDFLLNNLIDIDANDKLLKSALIYGANASGKSNLIKAIVWFKKIVLKSYSSLDKNVLKKIVIPFLLDKDTVEFPSDFEITFIENGIKYRYGISVLDGEIIEEWLYYTKKRETLLFYRERQYITEYNKAEFREANLFIKSGDNSNKKYILEKTAPHIPFISVLAVFQGEHSLNVTNFFSKIQSISGIEDENLGVYTFNLLKNDPKFYKWTLGILKDFHIADLVIDEKELFSHEIKVSDLDIDNNIKTPKKINVNQVDVRAKKYLNHSQEKIEFPLGFESSGTRKIIHLLGPLYDTIKKGNILFVDEFDSKFHTLLSKHIFKIFHNNCKNAQIIASVQDTNLMDTTLFRRDQIWFVHKDFNEQDSHLYSLSEYKNTIKESYSQDYLQGAFDAIPLFDSIDDIESLMGE